MGNRYWYWDFTGWRFGGYVKYTSYEDLKATFTYPVALEKTPKQTAN